MSETPDVPCPLCKELIKPDAEKCRWCGEYLRKDEELRSRLRKPLRQRLPAPDPTPILILGILGIFVCGICGAFALTKGNEYMDRCRALRIQPNSAAVWGRALGIVSCVLMAIQAVVGGLIVMSSFNR